MVTIYDAFSTVAVHGRANHHGQSRTARDVPIIWRPKHGPFSSTTMGERILTIEGGVVLDVWRSPSSGVPVVAALAM